MSKDKTPPEEKFVGYLEMAPAPWAMTADKDWIYSTVGVPNGGDIICIMPDMQASSERFPANAAGILSAVNNTYGAGINPNHIPDLLRATEMLLKLCNGLLSRTAYRNADETISFAKSAIEKSKL